MRTIAVAMQKGGSGKTTTTVNLAAALAEIGLRILIVDVDPQANASSWYGVREARKGMFTCLVEGAALASIVTAIEVSSVSIAPSSAWLVGAERALAGEVGAETILRRRLQPVSGAYDVALIDTPPTLGVLTIGALTAADEVLIPWKRTSSRSTAWRSSGRRSTRSETGSTPNCASPASLLAESMVVRAMQPKWSPSSGSTSQTRRSRPSSARTCGSPRRRASVSRSPSLIRRALAPRTTEPWPERWCVVGKTEDDMVKRSSSIGQSPLDSVVPMRTSSEPANPVKDAEHAIPAKREKVTVAIPSDLMSRLRAAAYWTRKPLAALVETAIHEQLVREERENGGPFTPLSTRLQPGRKVGGRQ